MPDPTEEELRAAAIAAQLVSIRAGLEPDPDEQEQQP